MPDLEDVRISRLQQLAADLAWPGASKTAQFQIAWMLFRSAANADDGDPCWSALIRRDLRIMPAARREAWLSLLDSNDHDYPFVTTPVSETLLAQLGQNEAIADLLRWSEWLVDLREPVLSNAGTTLLGFLIRICGSCEAPEADEVLYRIASAEWWSAPDCEWLAAYLPVLGSRPRHRAFACLEALMMNPVTADIGDVRRAYHAALNLSLLEVGRVVPPDGYPAQTAEHQRLSEFLIACDPANWRSSPSLPGIIDPLEPIRRSVIEMSKSDRSGWRRAVEQRYAWLRRHRADYAPDQLLFWRVELRKLIEESCV